MTVNHASANHASANHASVRRSAARRPAARRSTVRRRLTVTYARFVTRRVSQTGMSLLRIGYGLTLLAILLTNVGVREELWGPDGLYPWSAFTAPGSGHAFSLYALSSSPLWAEALFLGLIVLAVLFTLGWRTRLITPALWLLVWSWEERNPYLPDGGDNLMRIVLVFLCFADVSARFSLDARRRARTGRRVRRSSTRHRIGTAFHNSAAAAVVIQLCLLYVVAGLFKVQGARWQEGTALYYILRVAEYSIFPELARLLYEHAFIVYAVTYATVFLQAFFPLLLLRPITRHAAFVMVTMMHIGIGVLMGIPFFSLFMIATDLMLITDREYAAVGGRLRRRTHHLLERRSRERTVPA